MIITNKDIYSKLYIEVANKDKDYGTDLNTTLNEFLFQCENHPDRVVISELVNRKASNKEFLRMLFIAVFGSPIDDARFTIWKDKLEMDEHAFRKLVIKKIAYSGEAKLVGKRIISDDSNYRLSVVDKVEVNLTSFLFIVAYKTFSMMPKGFKHMIRKARGIA